MVSSYAFDAQELVPARFVPVRKPRGVVTRTRAAAELTPRVCSLQRRAYFLRNSMSKKSQGILDHAYEELESELPHRLARALGWVRGPERRWLRIVTGSLFVLGGCLWFLPVVGVELIPIGLLFLAQDIPFLQAPVGRAILWIVHQYRAVAAWWRTRRIRRQSAARQQ
jgi:hypothetical protein